MKVLLVLCIICSFSITFGKELDQDFKKYLIEQHSKDLNEGNGWKSKGVIVALFNKYTDLLFTNIKKYCVKHNLDVIKLQDINQEFLGSHVILDNGTLNGLSILKRNGDADISYSSDTKNMVLHFPIDFDHLYFVYHFSVKLLFLEVQGHLKGEVTHMNYDIKTDFNFKSLNATVDHVQTSGMGPINIILDDKNIVAAVVNLLSQLVTAVLHPILEGVVNQIVVSVTNNVVAEVNKDIYKFLHPNNSYCAL